MNSQLLEKLSRSKKQLQPKQIGSLKTNNLHLQVLREPFMTSDADVSDNTEGSTSSEDEDELPVERESLSFKAKLAEGCSQNHASTCSPQVASAEVSIEDETILDSNIAGCNPLGASKNSKSVLSQGQSVNLDASAEPETGKSEGGDSETETSETPDKETLGGDWPFFPGSNTYISRGVSPAREATESDARRHNVPPNYSLRCWDPSEKPILLLKSVFDAYSLGQWIYDECKKMECEI